MSYHRDHPRLRLDERDHLLGTRQIVAAFAHCHVDTVTRRFRPVACDVNSHLLLFDVDECLAMFRRSRRVA